MDSKVILLCMLVCCIQIVTAQAGSPNPTPEPTPTPSRGPVVEDSDAGDDEGGEDSDEDDERPIDVGRPDVLSCYECSSLRGVKDECRKVTDDTPTVPCNGAERDTCFKTSISGNIRRGCTVESQCGGNVHCCETQLCNTATTTTTATTLLAVATAVAAGVYNLL